MSKLTKQGLYEACWGLYSAQRRCMPATERARLAGPLVSPAAVNGLSAVSSPDTTASIEQPAQVCRVVNVESANRVSGLDPSRL
jgi:hypothetical protein